MPINSLQLLNNATSTTSQDIYHFRQQLIQVYPTLSADDWYLIGTDGCHLCEKIEQELTIIKNSYHMPNIKLLDVLELPEPLLTRLAAYIPILVTDDKILNYPFGMMDIIELL